MSKTLCEEIVQGRARQSERETVRKLVVALKECSRRKDLQSGVNLHLAAAEVQFDTNKYVASALINMYCKCGRVSSAREIFDCFINRDTAVWNCLLFGYVDSGENSTALELFTCMDCHPSPVTYVAALKACSGLVTENQPRKHEKQACLEKGLSIHKQLRELGFESNVVVANTLIDMYSKCGSMVNAREVFESMSTRDVVSWNSLILGYVENGESSTGMDVFMSVDCKPDLVTFLAGLKACIGLAGVDKSFRLRKGVEIHRRVKELGFETELVVATTLLDMYSKLGDMVNARNVFETLPCERRSVVTWNCLISGYVDNGESSRAMDLYLCMEQVANSVTFLAVLKACTSLESLAAGRRVHARICRLGVEQDVMVATSLLDFYGKCGNTRLAEMMFEGMSSPTLVSWNALLRMYSSLGKTFQVFSVVWRMEEAGVQMDGVTFLGVLTACSHGGMVAEGEKYFKMMCRCGISPGVEHYNCLVDMLGKANRLDEALAIARSMPFKANNATHGSLVRPVFGDTK